MTSRFVAKMEDVLEVYRRPYDPRRPQVCFDEKAKELQGDARAPLPAGPGRPERRDHEYERGGMANLVVFCEPLRGWRRVAATEDRTAATVARELRRLVDEDYPDAERVVLVCDNVNTHGPWSLYDAFPPEEAARIAARLEWHHTPEHGSWLNVAEIELSLLSRQCLKRRIPDRETLEREVGAWVAERNRVGAPVTWRFTTADARIKLRRLYPVTTNLAEHSVLR